MEYKKDYLEKEVQKAIDLIKRLLKNNTEEVTNTRELEKSLKEILNFDFFSIDEKDFDKELKKHDIKILESLEKHLENLNINTSLYLRRKELLNDYIGSEKKHLTLKEPLSKYI